MTEQINAEELFKKNFPQFATESGVCLSPYWDLFSAGVECAIDALNKGYIQTLEKENAELKSQNEELKGCHNCRHFAEPYKLCCYSLGDEDYDCRGRKWEKK